MLFHFRSNTLWDGVLTISIINKHYRWMNLWRLPTVNNLNMSLQSYCHQMIKDISLIMTIILVTLKYCLSRQHKGATTFVNHECPPSGE